nr:unnamed protein product [Callosobruchus chinensis]
MHRVRPKYASQYNRKENLEPQETIQTKLGWKSVLGDGIEELDPYILVMGATCYGLRRHDVRRMAYNLALRNGIEHPFKNGVAGRSWLDGFLLHQKNVFQRKDRNLIHRSVRVSILNLIPYAYYHGDDGAYCHSRVDEFCLTTSGSCRENTVLQTAAKN